MPATMNQDRIAEGYEESGTPDPYDDGAGFLLAHGWKPLGNPRHQNTIWRDPTKPLRASATTEPIMVVGEKGVKEQLMCRTGKGKKVAPGERVVIIPPVRPMSLQEALQEQLERNENALLDAVAKE